MTSDRKSKRKILPPNRALLAEKDGRRYALTFCLDSLGWRCWYRAKLWFLKGKTADQCRKELRDRMFTFHWIVPDYGTPITPPF